MINNLDLKSGHRSFSYVVSSVPFGTAASGFPFVDTAGNRISCNYADITIHYDGNQAQSHCVAWVEPSSVSYQYTPNSIISVTELRTEYTMNEVGAGTVSGMCGIVTFADGNTPGHVLLKAPNDALMDSVMIRLKDEPKGGQAGTVSIELTYGNITPFNPLRLDKFDRGV